MRDSAATNNGNNQSKKSIAGRLPEPPGGVANSAPSRLFVQNNEPIKFFIQRDTGRQFIAWLTNTITKHGGQVVQVVPLSGYVLIDPSTESGTRLLQKWMMPESRPSRHVVCYTFVRASIVAGELVPPENMKGINAFFREMNAPVEFYLHPALDNELAKKAAIEIEKCGGVTETAEESARVIIAPHKTKKEIVLWNDLVRKHDADENKCIEDLDWVFRSIETKTFEKTVHRKKDLGGRKPGAKRVEYTEQDDQNLVEYVAEKIPYSEAGGRLGNNLYLELEKNKSLYPWAQRHSWHSWRNRYKMRQLIFDVAIREYVNKHPPPVDGTRPAHPALIPLDDARDHDEDDEGRNNDNNVQTKGTRGAIDKRKRKTGASNTKRKKRTRRPPSFDSDADAISSQHEFDEDSDGYEDRIGEEVRALARGRQSNTQQVSKQRRKAASSITGDNSERDGVSTHT